MVSTRAYVYVLKCQGSPPNWYVESTRDLEARICEHFAGQGSLWTQKHAPVSVAEVLECPGGDPLRLERAKVVEMCFRHSWKQVRGAGFVKLDAGMPSWLDLGGERRRGPKSAPCGSVGQSPSPDEAPRGRSELHTDPSF